MAYQWNPGTAGQYPPPRPPGYGYPQAATAYSPWWKRVCAALLDGVVVSIPIGLLSGIAGAHAFTTNPATGQVSFHPSSAYWITLLVGLIGSFAYYTLLEGGPGGATVGKMALNIRVADESGDGSIGYGRALGRRLMGTLFWWLLIIPGLLDVLSPLWDARRQTWHDKVVRSVVVDKA